MDYELFVSLLMLIVGSVTLAVRNRPNPFIGVRFGYTYLSKEAWRKANTFAGLYCLILGLCFLVISLSVRIPFMIFFTMLVISMIPMTYYSYKIAKETYEKEDLSTPIGEVKPMLVDIKRILILELIPMILYVLAVAILWNRIPQKFAIHFGINGRPDLYASKLVGALLIPLTAMFLILALTILVRREPLLLRIPTYPSILVILQAFLAIVFFSVLLYNADIISITSMLFTILVCLIMLITIIALRYRIQMEG